jgi:hypothetical protein
MPDDVLANDVSGGKQDAVSWNKHSEARSIASLHC